MSLIAGSNPKFDELRDQLLQGSNASPIYAASFAEYYQAYSGLAPIAKMDFIISKGEIPVLLFLLGEHSSIDVKSQNYSYYGLPGLVALNTSTERAIQDLAVDEAIHHLREIGLFNSIKNKSFEVH